MKFREEYKRELAKKYGYDEWYMMHLALGSRIHIRYDELIDSLIEEVKHSYDAGLMCERILAKDKIEQLETMVRQHQNLKNQYREQIVEWERRYNELREHLRAVIQSHEND